MTTHVLIDRIKDSDIARRMTKGAFWSFTGTALGKFFVLLTGIVCARILGKEGFGELGIIRSTLGMFIILGAGGIGVTATRYISSYRNQDPLHAASIYRLSTVFSLITGLTITILLLIVSDALTTNVLKSDHLTVPLVVGSSVLLLSILNSSENGALAGLEDFRSIALNTLTASIVEAVCMIIGAYFFQLEGAVAGFGCGVLVLYLLNRVSALRGLHKAGIPTKGYHIVRDDWKLIYLYSLPATLSAIMVTPVFWFLRSMLVRAEGYGELGIFEAADQWKVILLFIPGAISQIVLPILSSITNPIQFRKTLWANLYLIGGVSLCLALSTWALAPFIMPLYGKSFCDLTPLVCLALSTFPTAIAQILEMTLYSKERMWTCLAFNLLWGGSVIAIAYLAIQNGKGATGIALAILLAYTLKMLCMSAYLMIWKQKGGGR